MQKRSILNFWISFWLIAFLTHARGTEIYSLPDPSANLVAKVGKVPQVGRHPRILIGPEDLPGLRIRLQQDDTARFIYLQIKGWMDAALNKKSRYRGPLAEAYEQLVAGNEEALLRVSKEDRWWKSNVSLAIQFEAFIALIENDADRACRAGNALACYVAIAVKRGPGYDPPAGLDLAVAYAYDFVYNYISGDKRSIIRNYIAQATFGRKPFGYGLPGAMANYNFVSHGTSLALMALAIEGEVGYDPEIYPATVAVLKVFLDASIDAAGEPSEDMHYFNFGMEMAAPSMVALARRGDSLFHHEAYRKLPNWYINELEPFGEAFSMHGDTPNDQGGLLANYVVMKLIWPKDPLVNFIWNNRVREDRSGLMWRGDLLFAALFADASEIAAGNRESVLSAARLPLSWQTKHRQHFVGRSDWSSQAAVFHFTTNHDQRGPSHTHSNALDFTFSALGRKWVIDRGFHVAESQHHSVILIDGKGQGFFPAPGFIQYSADTGYYATVSGDARYSYDYAYEFGNRIGLPYRKALSWEPEVSFPEIMALYKSRAKKDFTDNPWRDPAFTSFTHRAVYNPVEQARRTIVLRRGDTPYLLICDYIKKDDFLRSYDWLLQLADDLEIKSISGYEVVLGSTKPEDKRRLLVQMLSASTPAAKGVWRLEELALERSFETGSRETFGTGRRLRFSCQSVEPQFKVLIMPFNAGAKLPNVEVGDHGLRINDVDTYNDSLAHDGTKTLKVSIKP